MTKETFNEAAAEVFAQRMADVLASGSLALLCSIGDQTGLFDTWSKVGKATSTEIADESGLNERYVREWLGGIVSGGIAQYDPETSTYSLPAEHAVFLTSAGGPNNMARIMQFIPLLGDVEQEVIDKFRMVAECRTRRIRGFTG